MLTIGKKQVIRFIATSLVNRYNKDPKAVELGDIAVNTLYGIRFLAAALEKGSVPDCDREEFLDFWGRCMGKVTAYPDYWFNSEESLRMLRGYIGAKYGYSWDKVQSKAIGKVGAGGAVHNLEVISIPTHKHGTRYKHLSQEAFDILLPEALKRNITALDSQGQEIYSVTSTCAYYHARTPSPLGYQESPKYVISQLTSKDITCKKCLKYLH